MINIAAAGLVSTSETAHFPAISIPNDSDGNNAISYLTTKNQQQNVIFEEAIHLLDSMKSSPSCYRVAATRLVASCQAIDGKGAHNSAEYAALDRTRSVYAARLAICELDGAGASIPPACIPLTAAPVQARPRFLFSSKPKSLQESPVDDYPKETLGSCLKTLESRPQWWTSYSNNRQNAVVICQAVRMEIEKDELLNLHRSIVNSSAKLNNGLDIALEKAAMNSARNEEFSEAVRELQKRILVDLETTDLKFQDNLNKILDEMESGIGTVVERFSSTLNNIRDETAGLEKVDALQQSLKTAEEKELSALRVHEESALASQRIASDFHLSLESFMGSQFQAISQRMASLDASLEWLSSRLIQVLEQEHKLAHVGHIPNPPCPTYFLTFFQKLETMERSVEVSSIKANELQVAQHEQAKVLAAQSQVHKEIQFAAQVSAALIERAAATAANLQSRIEDAANKAKSIPEITFGSPSIFTLLFILILAVSAQNRMIAVGIIFMIFGWYPKILCLYKADLYFTGHKVALSFLQRF
ncbi:hypothetical protein N7540_012471 [Penicillium herquei]|nr:hypothetical protein N7540_012471 [Penicillium herquei]